MYYLSSSWCCDHADSLGTIWSQTRMCVSYCFFPVWSSSNTRIFFKLSLNVWVCLLVSGFPSPLCVCLPTVLTECNPLMLASKNPLKHSTLKKSKFGWGQTLEGFCLCIGSEKYLEKPTWKQPRFRKLLQVIRQLGVTIETCELRVRDRPTTVKIYYSISFCSGFSNSHHYYRFSQLLFSAPTSTFYC